MRSDAETCLASCRTRENAAEMCGRTSVQAQSAQSYAEHFARWCHSMRRSAAVVERRTRLIRVYAGGGARWGAAPWFISLGVDSLVRQGCQVGSRHQRRAETAATTAAFKDSFARNRCLIPADGFYEWEKRESGGKLRTSPHHADGSPLALAGLWGSWKNPEGERVTTCSIITTPQRTGDSPSTIACP